MYNVPALRGLPEALVSVLPVWGLSGTGNALGRCLGAVEMGKIAEWYAAAS